MTVKHSRPRATVLLSGGVDSAACMKFLQLQGFEVRTLFIDYGQRAAALERAAARALSENHKCSFEVVTASGNSHFGNGELLGRNAFLIFTALFFFFVTFPKYLLSDYTREHITMTVPKLS